MIERSNPRLLFFVLLLNAGLLGQRWEVTLSSGETYSDVRITGASDSTILMEVDFYEVSLPFQAIERLSYHSKMGLRLWGFLGGLTAGYVGYSAGKVFEEKVFEMPLESREDPIVLFPAATGAVLGAVFGADYARKTGRATKDVEYDLSTMTLEDKKAVVDGLLSRKNRSFLLTLASYLY